MSGRASSRPVSIAESQAVGFLSQNGRTTIYQRALQKVVLLSLDRNPELSLLTSSHTSFASTRRHDVLIPPVRETSRESWVEEGIACQ